MKKAICEKCKRLRWRQERKALGMRPESWCLPCRLKVGW